MKESRISREQLYFRIAEAVAERATCKKLKVGAVLVKDKRIIAIGYCGAPPGMPHCLDVGCKEVDGHCVRTLHAEASLISFCAKHGIATEGTELYVTHQPCFNCLKLLVGAGIRKVLYARCYGAVEDSNLISEVIGNNLEVLWWPVQSVKPDEVTLWPVESKPK